jgi:transcription elongation factor GreA
MIFGKKYKITAQKKEELEKELIRLETVGRRDIADKLDWLRDQVNDTEEEYDPFLDALDDKNYLEKRISEIKAILINSEVVEHSNSKEVEVGSTVTVGFEGFEEKYMIVSSIEADPMKKKISDESPVGKSLIGAKVGDDVEVRIGSVNKKFRIININ